MTKLGDDFTERVMRSAEGELLSVTMANGIIKASENGRVDISSNDKSNYKWVAKGDIAYNSMRMWQGACGYSKYDGILSPAYTVVVPSENVDVKFYCLLFKTDRILHQFRIHSQGLTSDTWNLKYPNFAKIESCAPKKKEQEAIAKFFANVIVLLNTTETKLTKVRTMKQGLLQKMFV